MNGPESNEQGTPSPQEYTGLLQGLDQGERPGGGGGAGLGGIRFSQSSVCLEANVGGGMQEGAGAVLLMWARDLC